MKRIKTFTNCRLCVAGKIIDHDLQVDIDTAKFVDDPDDQVEIVDLNGKTIAPGYLELQSNVSYACRRNTAPMTCFYS
jgi:N-acetylglucosamine-6-phosphate deacetylase